MAQEENKHAAVSPVSCYINVGDIIKGKCRNGFLFDGELFHMDIKWDGNQICPMISVMQRCDTTVPPFGLATIEVANITELELLKSKNEKAPSGALRGGSS